MKQVLNTARVSTNRGLMTPGDMHAVSTVLASNFFNESEVYNELTNSTHLAITAAIANMAQGTHGNRPAQMQHDSKHFSHEELDEKTSSGFLDVNVKINNAGHYACEVCNAFACQQQGIVVNGKRTYHIEPVVA